MKLSTIFVAAMAGVAASVPAAKPDGWEDWSTTTTTFSVVIPTSSISISITSLIPAPPNGPTGASSTTTIPVISTSSTTGVNPPPPNGPTGGSSTTSSAMNPTSSIPTAPVPVSPTLPVSQSTTLPNYPTNPSPTVSPTSPNGSLSSPPAPLPTSTSSLPTSPVAPTSSVWSTWLTTVQNPNPTLSGNSPIATYQGAANREAASFAVAGVSVLAFAIFML